MPTAWQVVIGSILAVLGALPAFAQTKLIVHGGSPSPNIAYINLYVGQQCVARHVPSAQADERLVELIRAHGRWIDRG